MSVRKGRCRGRPGTRLTSKFIVIPNKHRFRCLVPCFANGLQRNFLNENDFSLLFCILLYKIAAAQRAASRAARCKRASKKTSKARAFMFREKSLERPHYCKSGSEIHAGRCARIYRRLPHCCSYFLKSHACNLCSMLTNVVNWNQLYVYR